MDSFIRVGAERTDRWLDLAIKMNVVGDKKSWLWEILVWRDKRDKLLRDEDMSEGTSMRCQI